MKNEIEAKFVNIDIDDIRSRLQAIGATLSHPMRDMQRVTIDTPELKSKDAFVRIRNEGDKTTITYKQFNSLSIGDVMAAYRVQYPHLGLNDTIGNLAEVRFNDPLPGLLTANVLP